VVGERGIAAQAAEHPPENRKSGTNQPNCNPYLKKKKTDHTRVRMGRKKAPAKTREDDPDRVDRHEGEENIESSRDRSRSRRLGKVSFHAKTKKPLKKKERTDPRQGKSSSKENRVSGKEKNKTGMANKNVSRGLKLINDKKTSILK